MGATMLIFTVWWGFGSRGGRMEQFISEVGNPQTKLFCLWCNFSILQSISLHKDALLQLIDDAAHGNLLEYVK